MRGVKGQVRFLDAAARSRAFRILPITVAGFALVLILPALPAAQGNARKLVSVAAPNHDPLFVDMASVQRKGAAVAFKYVLDVLVEFEGKAVWKSSEVEATIDCAQRTFMVRRLVAYPGPRATGTATGVHSFMAPTPKPEKIVANSTFAHLEEHLCRKS